MKENLIYRYHIDNRNTLLTWAKIGFQRKCSLVID